MIKNKFNLVFKNKQTKMKLKKINKKLKQNRLNKKFNK